MSEVFPGALEPPPRSSSLPPLCRERGGREVTRADRVASHSSPQGLYEKALEDSEKALGLDGENIRALFRKARALSELGRHKEAYECSSRCSLARPHVSALSPGAGLGSAEPVSPPCRGPADTDIYTELWLCFRHC